MLKNAFAPHLRRSDLSAHMSVDVLIALLALCIFSAVYYGFRPVLLVLVGMLSAIVCETLCCLLMRRKPSVLDGTAAVTGGLIGAVMSPLSPYWLPAAAAMFAILVVKMPFGGSGRNLFNPAAAGIAAVTLCFPARLFTYPDPGILAPLPLANTVTGVITENSSAALLSTGGDANFSWLSLLTGDFPGPIGATSVIVVLACAVYLFVRRSASPLITFSFLATCALGAALFPRVSGSWYDSILREVFSGYLLFGGIFLLNDPVTAPRQWLGRCAYGVLAGVLTMLLRHFGQFEEGMCFAVLFVNACAPVLDRWCWRLVHTLRQTLQNKRAGADL